METDTCKIEVFTAVTIKNGVYETDPVPDTLRFQAFRIPDDGWSP
jgi:hypothetical protein